MSIYDLLFIVLFLTSVVTLITAGVQAIRGKGWQALRTLRNFAICFFVYMAIVVIVAVATPRRVLNIGEVRCFDDWCVSVTNSQHQVSTAGVMYNVTLELSSRARRISQRAKGAYVYAVDDQDRRFDPVPDGAAVPMDVLLQPGEKVETKRSFILPDDARGVGIIVVHEGAYCFPGCFIIGDEAGPFRKRTVVRLP